MTRFDIAADALQIGPELGRRLVAELAILLEAVGDDLLQPERQVGVERRRRQRRLVQDCRERHGRRLPRERMPSSRALVQHHAERKQIRAAVQLLAAGLLRRHIGDRAQRDTRRRPIERHDPIPLFPLDYRSAPAPVSVSESRILTHAIVEYPRMQFQWVSRTTGELQQLVMEPGDYRSFDLSPDGRRLAFTRAGDGNMSLWVHDLEQGTTLPWTFGDTAYTEPRWTKDSHRLLATKWQPEPQGIVQVLASGSESVVSTAVEPSVLDDVSLDGQYVLYRHRGLQLLAKPLGEGSETNLVRKAPSGVMDQAQFSTDIRWIAYNADETGRFEVYVTPFPAKGERQSISSGGGVQPVWRRDGRELYYLGLNGILHAVELRPDGERLQPSVRQLFQTGLAAASPNVEQYAASADGQRFLILRPVDTKVRSSIGVVFNWRALLTPARSR